jgi:hypothetical protein
VHNNSQGWLNTSGLALNYTYGQYGPPERDGLLESSSSRWPTSIEAFKEMSDINRCETSLRVFKFFKKFFGLLWVIYQGFEGDSSLVRNHISMAQS